MKIPPPTILQIELTKNCNLKCVMCHKGQMPPGKDFLRNDISDIALEQTKPLFPYLKKAMLFGDGEPMVYPKFWDVVKEIRKASPDCVIDFINNGTMMHQQNIQKCLDYEVDKMGVSLGGATEDIHNKIRLGSNLREIKENFLLMKRMKAKAKTLLPILSANIVVMKSNYRELPKFIEMCHNLGFLFVNFQKLWVTHSSMIKEQLSDEQVEPYFIISQHISNNFNMTLSHYPLKNKKTYTTHSIIEKATNEQKNLLNNPIIRKKTVRQFQPQYDPIKNPGYCKNQEPWNTIYVLHDGKVVPDCHWWTSINNTEINTCGTLNENNNIFDIWNNSIYRDIRKKIQNINYLPQCRGCGMAGGVIEEYRCKQTDHTNPEQETKQFIQLNIKKQEITKPIYVNMNICVLFLGSHGLGENILLTPCMKALKNIGFKIILAIRENQISAFEQCNFIDDILPLKLHCPKTTKICSSNNAMCMIIKAHYYPTNNKTLQWIQKHKKTHTLYVVDNNKKWITFVNKLQKNNIVEKNPIPIPEEHRFSTSGNYNSNSWAMKAAQWINIKLTDPKLQLDFKPLGIKIDKNKFNIGISFSHEPFRHMSPKFINNLSKQLQKNNYNTYLIFHQCKEKDQINWDNCIDVTTPCLKTALSYLANMDILVCVDSGLMHAALAMNIPTIIIEGRTSHLISIDKQLYEHVYIVGPKKFRCKENCTARKKNACDNIKELECQNILNNGSVPCIEDIDADTIILKIKEIISTKECINSV